MLSRFVNTLRCPTCCAALSCHPFDETEDGHIRNGLLACNACAVAYPIDDELCLLTVPALMPRASLDGFSKRFASAIAECGLRLAEASASDAAYEAQYAQRDHFDWFAGNEDLDYTAYAQRPMWMAADALAFARWNRLLPETALLLDVGCANGRATFPMAKGGTTVVGMDVSEKMLRQAIARSRENGSHASTSFLLADGNALPFMDGSFDAVMTYGVLHHLPIPKNSCREFQRVLARGGIYLGSENHESPLRPIFDFTMKLLPLWQEKAGAEPLISMAKLKDWHEGLDVTIEARFSVYLPPHLFNVLGKSLAYASMMATDMLFNSLPGIRKAGGLIVYEIRPRG